MEKALKKEESDLLSQKNILSKEDYGKKMNSLRNKSVEYQKERRSAIDKITAKTIPIKIKLGDSVQFGLLEIKALKCGISKSTHSKNNSVAYLQVRDVSENQNEKVFIFNGWTFSSNPSLAPIDHAIYDIWLVGCESV